MISPTSSYTKSSNYSRKFTELAWSVLDIRSGMLWWLVPYSTPPTLAAFDATPYLRLVKHGRAVLHAASSSVDGAWPTTRGEAISALPNLAVPEGQVHILQLTMICTLSTVTVIWVYWPRHSHRLVPGFERYVHAT